MFRPTEPALVLAPMEGVTDAPMRALQGASGAFTYAVAEFLRVSHAVPGPAVFHRHVPELRSGGRTPTGLPVQVQLLGGEPGLMAEAAVVAGECGATAVDLNFGCPSKTVNNHDGGATLLKYPARLRGIVRAVRDALPPTVPVSAKLRLGWDDVRSVFENAAMAVEGGAAWLTIHARTRMQGYAPPVDWPLVGRVRETLGVPVIANGDINTLDGFRRCRDETGCTQFMIGRGAVAQPGFARAVAAELGIADSVAPTPIDWADQMRQLAVWTPGLHDCRPDRSVKRPKQWLKMAEAFGAFDRFDDVKRARNFDELLAILATEPAAV